VFQTARIAFAGLSPLCEDILQAALRDRPDIEFVQPWTQLPALTGCAQSDIRELLFVELIGDELPSSLRVLLIAAEPLKIVGLSPDARSATMFTITEQRTVLSEYSAGELWDSVANPPRSDYA
jgi:hypothetical protein